MRPQKSKLKMLITVLLLAWAAAPSCATKGLPPPPQGELYNHKAPLRKAICSRLKDGSECPALPIEQTNNFYMMSPKTFESVQNYIDELIRIIEKKSLQAGPSPKLELTLRDLIRTKRRLAYMRETLED